MTLPLNLIYFKVTTTYPSLTQTSHREKLFQHLLLSEHAPRMRAVIKQSYFGDQSWMTWTPALPILVYIRLYHRSSVRSKFKSRWMVICHAAFIPSNLLLKLASLHVSLQAYSGTNGSCLFDRGLLLADESQSSSKRVRGCPKTNCRLPFVVLDLIECSLELRSYSSVTLPLSLIYSEVTTSYFSLTRTSLREKLF